MDAQYFTMNVHHGGYFTLNPHQYMGGAMGIVDNCNAEMCSKCEIESICKQFGYTSISKLWYRMLGVNLENATFHMIVNNNDAMFMADLASGYGEIDLFVEHPIDEPIEVEVEEIHSRSLELGKELVIVTNSGESDLEEEDAALMHLNQNSDGGDSWDSDDDVVEQVERMSAEVMNSDYETEEFLSLDESSSSNDDDDDDDNCIDNSIRMSNYPVFKPVLKAGNIRFEKDMLFISPKQFKDAITEYAIHGGWGIRFKKNDKKRVRAVCQEGCKFVAYLAKISREMSYQLKTLNLEHTCSRSYKNPRCTAKFLAKKLVKKVRHHPELKVVEIQDAMHEKYVVQISASKASRARGQAHEFVDRSYTEQYNKLWDYCAELRRSSPGSSIIMKVQTFNEGDLAAEMDLLPRMPYFQRLYMCLKACKRGFLAACMPIIGLDACHLKTKLGGHLIAAVVRDPNEEYFPLAIVVVEAETKDSWTWFLNLLLTDIGEARRWTFISDQQNGLVQTFADNWPQYDHGICCRHLYNNLRKNHPGVLIREFFWKAAKATYLQEYERVMNETKEIDEGAYNWLQDHSTTIWSRHMFRGDAMSDTILNNMCESFNSRILKFRGKPIISMLEDIKLYLMGRFQLNKETILKFESELCTKVKKRLYKDGSGKWLACWVGHTKFKAKNGVNSFIVDLAEYKCNCRKWEICHAISCIFFNREDAEKYVNDCYKVNVYKACYESMIEPINGQNMWQSTGLPSVQPPIKRRPPGRPKKVE